MIFDWCLREEHDKCIQDSSKELPKRITEGKPSKKIEGFEQLYCECECHD